MTERDGMLPTPSNLGMGAHPSRETTMDSLNIHRDVYAKWDDLGIEAPYELQWGRDFEPHKW